MNDTSKQRRLVLKALSLAGFTGLVGLSSLQLMKKNNTSWVDGLKTLHTHKDFSLLSAQFPNPVELLDSYFNLKQATEQSWITTVHSQIELDFKNAQTLVLNEWHLSKTEVLLILAAISLFGVETKQPTTEKNIENAAFETFIEVQRWGPQETYKGVKFNEQPDGHCGIWFVATGMPDSAELYINGKKSNIFINEKGFTTGIYRDVEQFINTVGSSEILVYDTINHRKQVVGSFTVLPPFEFHQFEDGSVSNVFGKVNNWGPKNAILGQPFNQQPNGYAAFWFKINSMSTQVTVLFNNHEIKATVRKDLITASLPVNFLPKQPGDYPVSLKNTGNNEQIYLGDITIVSAESAN